MADPLAGVSSEKIAEWRSVFRMFDKDSSGAISADELATVMRALGQNPCKKEIDDMIKALDKNKNGVIEFTEFAAWYKTKEKPADTVQDELRKAFRYFDKDGSGLISAQELKTAMMSLGEKLSEGEVDEMLKEADVNGDGSINYEEFMVVMMK